MKTYAYSFDQDGYYLGLCRATLDPLTKQLIFPHNSTDQEPYWKDGYQSRWDFTLKNWTLEPRGEKKHRMEVEKELILPLIERLDKIEKSLHHLNERSAEKMKIIDDLLTPINKNTILFYEKIDKVHHKLNDIDNSSAAAYQALRQHLNDNHAFAIDQRFLLERMNAKIALLARPTFFQRLKRKLSFGFMRRL